MRALLGPGYRPSVLWQEEAPLPRPDTGPVPDVADVVVVGGGYCGLAAAAELARRGAAVVLLDRERLGSGASTRNGGMVIPELKAGPLTLERRYGQLGRRMHAEVEDAFDHVEALLGASDPSGGAAVRGDADYERCGQLLLAHGDRGAAQLDALAEEHCSIGDVARVVRGEGLEAECGSSSFAAGLLLERTGGLHPAKFHAVLVDAAASAGASLFGRVEALGIRHTNEPGRPLVVDTSRGPVRCSDVLLATNAYADGVDPGLRRGVLPMSSFIIATEPLPPDLAATVLPTGRMAFDDRNLLRYWRHGPDGRFLFGGRRRLGRVRLEDARDHLYRSMLEVYPQLHGVRVERAWGGEVALTLDRMPHCGHGEGVWYATGCNGSGVALNTWMGRRMAGAVLGGELPPFAELAFRPVPLRRARRAWLPLVGAWFALADRRDARRSA